MKKSVLLSALLCLIPVVCFAAWAWNGSAITVWNGAWITAWNGVTVASCNVAYSPPQAHSDDELDGSTNYYNNACLLGFQAVMTQTTVFNQVVARMWCNDATTAIQWKLFIRSAGTAFDASSVTPTDSGTIAAGNFPTLSARVTVQLNSTWTANTGQYVFFLFLAANGAKVSISDWAYDALISPARLGFPLKVSSGWGTFSFSNAAGAYGQPGMKLLLRTGF